MATRATRRDGRRGSRHECPALKQVHLARAALHQEPDFLWSWPVVIHHQGQWLWCLDAPHLEVCAVVHSVTIGICMGVQSTGATPQQVC